MALIFSEIKAAGFYSFLLELSHDRVFECVEIVRVLPKKRLVCRGNFNQKFVYAKIFIGKSSSYYALRDKAGSEALKQAGIETPTLLLASELENGAHILIYSAIKDAQNAEVAMKCFNEQARFALMQKLVQTLAQHHQAGLLQTDLYLKNFLVAGDDIYTLDGDGVRPLSKNLINNQKLSNLATLFSKMDILEDVWIEHLYRTYCDEIGTELSEHAVSKMQYLTQKIRHHVACRYTEKKVFRTCTDVKTIKSFRCFEAVSADFRVGSQDLLSLDLFLINAKVNIKSGNTCSVAKATLANRQVIIKRYNIKSFWHGLKRAFRITRAAKSWANAHRLIISNIATAKPLALVEERIGCLRRRAYYLSEYVDAPDAQQFFVQSTSHDEKNVAAHNLAKLFYKLYLLKFSHGDFKATNVKLVNLEPVLIDLDSVQAHFGCWFSEWRFERAHIKDLKRFMKNWQDNSEISSLLKEAIIEEYATDSSLTGILIRAGIA